MRALVSLGAVLVSLAAPAAAAQIHAFDDAAFHALQAQNAPAIVFVHAPWCPICRAQEQTLRKLIAIPKYQKLTVLTIDFDSQKPLWTRFGVKQQSTLIAYHGRREAARLAFDSDPQKVTALVDASLR